MQHLMDGQVEDRRSQAPGGRSPTMAFDESMFESEQFSGVKNGYLKRKLLSHPPSDFNSFANELNDLLTQYHQISECTADYNPYPTPSASRASMSSRRSSLISRTPSPAFSVMSLGKLSTIRKKAQDEINLAVDSSDMDSEVEFICKKKHLKNNVMLPKASATIPLVVNLPKNLTLLLQSKGDELLQSYVNNFNEHCLVSNWTHYQNEQYRVPCEIVKVLVDGCVAGTVNFVKSLDGFRALSEEDRVVLVKGAWLEIQIWRFLFVLNKERTHWGLMDKGGVIKEFRIEQVFGGYGCALLQRFLTLACQMGFLRFDRKLMVIIYSLIIFYPYRQNLEKKEFVRDFQEFYYMRLLREYLSTTYTQNESNYAKVLDFVDEIRAISQQIKQALEGCCYLKNVCLMTATPVVIELLDLQ